MAGSWSSADPCDILFCDEDAGLQSLRNAVPYRSWPVSRTRCGHPHCSRTEKRFLQSSAPQAHPPSGQSPKTILSRALETPGRYSCRIQSASGRPPLSPERPTRGRETQTDDASPSEALALCIFFPAPLLDSSFLKIIQSYNYHSIHTQIRLDHNISLSSKKPKTFLKTVPPRRSWIWPSTLSIWFKKAKGYRWLKSKLQ